MAVQILVGQCSAAHAFVAARPTFKPGRPTFLTGTQFLQSENVGTRIRCQAPPGPGGEAEFQDLRRSVREALLGVGAQDEGGGRRPGVRDPLGGMLTAASQKLQRQLEEAMGQAGVPEGGLQRVPRSWLEWLVYFEENDEREKLLQAMKAQIEDAVSREEYTEAARIKATADVLQCQDVVEKVVEGLKAAVLEERYDDAAKLRDQGGAGLIGWWAGLSPDDPHGRVMQIKPGHGRYVGSLHTAVQLVKGKPGTPVMEVFMAEDTEGTFHQQAVYLDRKPESPPIQVRTVSPENMSEVDEALANATDAVMEGEEVVVEILTEGIVSDEELEQIIAEGDVIFEEVDEEEQTSESEGETVDDGPSTSGRDEPSTSSDEPLNKMLRYFKDKLPGANVKLFGVLNPSGPAADIPGLINKLVNWQQQKMEDASTSSNSKSSNSSSGDKTRGQEPVRAQKRDGLSSSSSEEPSTSSSSDDQRTQYKLGLDLLDGPIAPGAPKPEELPSRVQAHLQAGLDAFVFTYDAPPAKPTSNSSAKKEAASQVPKADLQALIQAFEKTGQRELDPSSEEGAAVLGSLTALLSAAMGQKKRADLPPSIMFTRITPPEVATDSLTGLFVGAFGPHGPELVQLKRRIGQWEMDENSYQDANSRQFGSTGAPYEYVEATKLTGDVNVPAGVVSFRAKVGPQFKLSTMEYLGTELGVVARYKGEGRFALPGFKNPRWVEGELLVLDGRAGFLTSGAELGFIFDGPAGGRVGAKRFLVLFNRVKLPE